MTSLAKEKPAADLPPRDLARVLLLDPDDRLLLIRYEAVRDVDPARPGRRDFWFTPGGGREEGESFEEAARRELEEETGLKRAEIGPCVGRRDVPFTLFRKPRFAHERYFLVRAPSPKIDTSRLQETEDNPVLGTRWWTLSELRGTDDPVEPKGLVALFSRVLIGDVPTMPVDLA